MKLQMKQFKIWIAIALLIASILILVVMLFSSQTIQIVLETGQAVTTRNSNYFTITTVMIFIIASFIVGASIMYLFYNSDYKESSNIKSNEDIRNGYDIILPLLKDDEKKAVHIIKEHNGEMLQNQLVLRLGLSKVKITRLISGLERKGIIEKSRHGMTNNIKLKYRK